MRSAHLCGRGTLDPRRHPSPPWQNKSVESWWCVEPENIVQLTRMARRSCVERDPEWPRNQQGLRVLGVPIGQREFVRDFVEVKAREQATLFQRIPWVQDTQAGLLVAPHVWLNEGQFLVEVSLARPDGGVRRTTRHCCLGMSPRNLGNTLSSR